MCIDGNDISCTINCRAVVVAPDVEAPSTCPYEVGVVGFDLQIVHGNILAFIHDPLEQHFPVVARQELVVYLQVIGRRPTLADHPPRVLVRRLDHPPVHPQRQHLPRPRQQSRHLANRVRRLGSMFGSRDDLIARPELLDRLPAIGRLEHRARREARLTRKALPELRPDARREVVGGRFPERAQPLVPRVK